MAYADFAFYRDVYKGTAVPEESFDGLCRRASAVVDYITFNRIRNDSELVTDDVRMAVCSVLDGCYSYDQTQKGGAVQSESVGNWSVTYAVNADTGAASLLRDLRARASVYLAHTGLMYRGV